MVQFAVRVMVVAVTSIMLVGALVMPVGASAEGNSEAAHLCEEGGYLNYTDANGNGFTNAGQCTRYAAQGGELKAVSLASLSIEYGAVTENPSDPGSFYAGLYLIGSGLEPDSPVTLVGEYLDGSTFTRIWGYADANGNFYEATWVTCGFHASFTLLGTAADGSPVSVTSTPIC